MILLLSLGATACFICLVAGWRLLRTPGLDALAPDLAIRSDGMTEPFITRVIDRLGITGQQVLLRAYGPRRRMRLDERLHRAGRPEGLTDRSFLRRKAGFGTIGLFLLVLLWFAGQPLFAVLSFALCLFWMDLWLRAVGRNRQREIAQRLPDFLDVLAVTVTAGLGLQAALERVVDNDDSALGQEVRRTLNDMKYGLSRRAALEGLRERNDVPSLGSFVSAMLQAEELGTPLAQALIDIAAEVRRESAQVARQVAAKAGPKVSLVVTVTIVPGAMLLITSAMVLANLPRFRGIFG